jgi:hypothetical protein
MTTDSPPRSSIETDHLRAWLRPDGLIEIDWGPGFTIDAALAQTAVAAGKEVGGGVVRGLLIDMRQSGIMNKEARAIFASDDSWVYAVALWVGSPMSTVIANFFLGVNRVPRPTRLFTKEADAVAWLTAQRP